VEHGEGNPDHETEQKPVAVLKPYRPPLMTPERQKAIRHAIDVMAKGLPWGGALRTFRRDEMHER